MALRSLNLSGGSNLIPRSVDQGGVVGGEVDAPQGQVEVGAANRFVAGGEEFPGGVSVIGSEAVTIPGVAVHGVEAVAPADEAITIGYTRNVELRVVSTQTSVWPLHFG